MVDYYTSDCLIDFHKNWLKMKFTLGHRLRTIRWLKMKYKEQIQKKGKYLVFSGVDGLLLFKFSKDLWGSEIVISVFEAFKKLRPGIPLKCLHGRMKQERRKEIYAQFCEKHSVLFSTDVASRDLDFNKVVDWVVQVRFWLFKEATSVL
ncbi:hypothetical protein LWI29_006765 [Acer saccharum]|uniref:ATP-dependent RNA helicase n=1 Tax=Acer saccharum TaxID=4024 RepID=A0AA39T082_ACESA|nr:hypothetical protein LWI29_006765 [Acer saccharum]